MEIAMTIKLFKSKDIRQNVYLYYDEKSGEGVIIDAGCNENDVDLIKAELDENNINIKAILLTHGHIDHIVTVEELKQLTGAMVYSHEAEKLLLSDPALNLSIETRKVQKITPDKYFKDGDIFAFGETALKVIHTPGHTQGGACYYDEKNRNLFTGDVLFSNSIGRTDLPQGDTAALINGIRTKLMTLPDDTNVFPGHSGTTTIGREKMSNPFL